MPRFNSTHINPYQLINDLELGVPNAQVKVYHNRYDGVQILEVFIPTDDGPMIVGISRNDGKLPRQYGAIVYDIINSSEYKKYKLKTFLDDV